MDLSHLSEQKFNHNFQDDKAPTEHSQKLTLYLFRNDVVLYFESSWKRENTADINFWCFIKLNDWALQYKKNKIFQLTRSNFTALKSEEEIRADNSMRLKCPSHLE